MSYSNTMTEWVGKRTTLNAISGEALTVPGTTPYRDSLAEAPDVNSGVTLSGTPAGAASAYTEVTTMPTQSGEYYVDYYHAYVYFHVDDASGSATATYNGRGHIVSTTFSDELRTAFTTVGTFVGQVDSDDTTPPYSSENYVTVGDDLVTAIGDLDAGIVTVVADIWKAPITITDATGADPLVTISGLGQIEITNLDDTKVPLTINAITGQTANILALEKNSVAVASFNNAGNLTLPTITATVSGAIIALTGQIISLSGTNTSAVPLTIAGQAGHTANLLEIKKGTSNRLVITEAGVATLAGALTIGGALSMSSYDITANNIAADSISLTNMAVGEVPFFTNTTSGQTALLLDLQKASASKFNVDIAGAVTAAGGFYPTSRTTSYIDAATGFISIYGTSTEIMRFNGNSASNVNYFEVKNARTGNAPTISAVGPDAAIDLALTPKSVGKVILRGSTAPQLTALGLGIVKSDASGDITSAALLASEMPKETGWLHIYPPFAGANHYADGGTNALTIVPGIEMDGTFFRPYYEGSSSEVALQDREIWVMIPLPEDFVAFFGATTAPVLFIDVATESTNAADNKLDITVLKQGSATTVTNTANVSRNVAGVWLNLEADANGPDLDYADLATTLGLSAGDTMVVKLKLYSKDDNYTRVGGIHLRYDRRI